MNMLACYRFLLRFYADDFRRQFSEEMLHVFEQKARERMGNGKTASVLFVLRELVSLLRGAHAMWMEKILPLRWKQETQAGTPENALSPAEISKRREQAAARMVQAIANHDFPGARYYSAEEIRLKVLLLEGSGPAGSQHAGAA